MKRENRLDKGQEKPQKEKIVSVPVDRDSEKRLRFSRGSDSEGFKDAMKAAGAIVGGLAGYKWLSGPAADMAGGVGEGLYSFKVMREMIENGVFPKDDANISHEYIEKLPKELQERYEEVSKKDYLRTALDSAKTSMEGMQRASEKVPGANSKPVREARGLREKIMEETKSWFVGEGEEKEDEIRGKENYQNNYNELARLVEAARMERSEIREDMAEYCRELKIREAKGEEIGKEELGALEKMTEKYVEVSNMIKDRDGLNVEEIYGKSEEYEEIVEQAEEYGINTPDFSNWRMGGTAAATIGLAILGAKAIKPIATVANGTRYALKKGYDAASYASSGAAKIARGARDFIEDRRKENEE